MACADPRWGANCSIWQQIPSPVAADAIYRSLNHSAVSVRCAGQFWQGKLPQAPEDVQLLRAIAFDYIMPIVWALGIFGNLLNLAVLRSFKGRTFVCLYWLAISDLLALVLDMGTMVTVDFFRRNYFISFIMCRFSCMYINMFICASNFIVVALTIERFYAVYVPMKARKGAFSGKPVWSVMTCFVLAVLVYLPSYFNYTLTSIEHSLSEELAPSFHCYVCQWSRFQERPDGWVYVCFREIFSRVIPVFLVVILNIGMVFALRAHQRSRVALSECSGSQSSIVSDAEIEEDRLKRLLVAVMVLFVVCNTPTVLRFILMKSSGINELLPEIFVFAANLLALFNIACNFYVYCFCSAAVRARVWQLFRGVVYGNSTTYSMDKKPTVT